MGRSQVQIYYLEEKTLTPALIINLIIFILEIKALADQYKHDGTKMFIYYTIISNALAGIAGLVFCIAAVISLAGGTPVPVMIKGLRLTVTLMLAVTFIVVITILAPGKGKGGYKKMMIDHNSKYVHFICPVISIISFIFFEAQPALDFSWTFIAMIPTVIYAAVAIYCNYKRIWSGPYDFLKVHDQTPLMSVIWSMIILGGAYLISFLLWRFN